MNQRRAVERVFAAVGKQVTVCNGAQLAIDQRDQLVQRLPVVGSHERVGVVYRPRGYAAAVGIGHEILVGGAARVLLRS